MVYSLNVSCINLLELSLPRSPQFPIHHCFVWEGKQGSQAEHQANLHPGIVWQVQWRNPEVHRAPWQHEEKSPGRRYCNKSDKQQIKTLHQPSKCSPAVFAKTTHVMDHIYIYCTHTYNIAWSVLEVKSLKYMYWLIACVCLIRRILLAWCTHVLSLVVSIGHLAIHGIWIYN